MRPFHHIANALTSSQYRPRLLPETDISPIYELGFFDILHREHVEDAQVIAEMMGRLKTLPTPSMSAALSELRKSFSRQPLSLRVRAANEFMTFSHALAHDNSEDVKHLRELYDYLTDNDLVVRRSKPTQPSNVRSPDSPH